MIITNYHTHSSFCDGKYEPEVYTERAISLGMKALGFSSHAPIPQENDWTMKPGRIGEYVKRIRGVRDRYKDEIEVYCGLEIDFIPGVSGPSSPEFSRAGLDYTIGSVHLIYDEEKAHYYGIDGSEESFLHLYTVIFNGDIKSFVREYYARIGTMAREHRPSIIGHFDIVKKHNRGGRFFDEAEPWYREAALGALEAVREAGSCVEVNTGGLARGITDEIYPSPWILKECRTGGIPVTLNSDAHNPEHLLYYFPESRGILKDSGYTSLRVLLGGSFTDIPLE